MRPTLPSTEGPDVRFVLGVLIGAVLGVGALWGHDYLRRKDDPCLGRCGDGTHCDAGACLVTAVPSSKAPASKRSRRMRGGGDSAPITLAPGDTKIAAEGDSLKRPTTRLDLTDERDAPPLNQEQIDDVFAPQRSAISDCVVAAVGDAPLESARVTVSFRIEASGEVRGVRVEAPQLLLRNHLYACVRPRVAGLHFPRASSANIASFPFELK